MSDQPFDPRGSKSARNERCKLLASTFNTVGLTAFGLGVLTPLINRVTESSGVTFILGCVILVVLHLTARSVLRGLED